MAVVRTATASRNYRYIQLSNQFETRIKSGFYHPGEKLPSIRKVHRQTGYSISTVFHAYIELEKRGLVEARAKSGYYVQTYPHAALAPPSFRRHRARPRKVNLKSLAREIVRAMSDPTMIQLGGTLTAPALLPSRALSRIIKRFNADKMQHLLNTYADPSGCAALKTQIAKRLLDVPGLRSADDLVITSGCIEAVSLCLRAVAGPGDTIVVESPTYPWFLQVIEDLNMLALEVPTDPLDGIDLGALEEALDSHPVKACLLVPNFQNPLGYRLTRDHKRALVEMAVQRRIAVIEDDIHGDIYFDGPRPSRLKSFDRDGWVLCCSSFSKTLAPGLRVGWVLPGRFADAVKRLKLDLSIASPALNQQAVAIFLETEGYERHLRRLRQSLKTQAAHLAMAVSRHFPTDTRISTPRGGLTLWVECHSQVDALKIFHAARRENIAILPGTICATSDRFRHCIRLSFGFPWNAEMEAAVKKLGRYVAAR
ncbi:MAG: PLP-dependent aminotransferase family protein [Desulfobacterales bacterium]|nr:PLP-dependent aminotransferase family protein [Desulfobacterales bacterium]